MNNIKNLKEEKDAAILAHYYVDEEIQKNADFVGDSFFLAQIAQKLNNKRIVMAGVYFMGESIKILNPDKKVLMVDKVATCPMVNMISVEKIKKIREMYDDIAVVCYINSSAEIKAHCDVCVTSSNALKIVKKLKEKNIFFVPDGNLGAYIAKEVHDKNIILNDGYCPVHNDIRIEDLISLKRMHIKAKVLAHPENRQEVLSLADYVGSTSGIIKEAGGNLDEYIIATEKGIDAKLKELYTNKKFYYLDNCICDNMKLLNMNKLISTLEKDENEVFVNSEVAKKAFISLERMLELGA